MFYLPAEFFFTLTYKVLTILFAFALFTETYCIEMVIDAEQRPG